MTLYLGEIECDQKNEAYMFGECRECETITCLKPETNHNDVSWWYWGQNENSKVEKQQLTGTLVECCNELATRCTFFLRNTFIKRMQARAHSKMKESVKNEATKIVTQLYFAENHTTQVQNAIQSSYWVSKQFTLFTVCAWEKNTYITHLSLSLITCHMTNTLYWPSSLSKGDVIQNLDDFVQVAEECSESITVLKCTKKHVESLVSQIDKDTIYCAGITGLRKPGIHCIKVLAPYVIETKVQYYSSSTPHKHVFKTLQVKQTTTPETASNNILSETPPPTANDTVHNKLTSIDAVTAGQWLLVEYEGEFFLGLYSLSLQKPQVLIFVVWESHTEFQNHRIWKRNEFQLGITLHKCTLLL